ncbi:MAG: serine/threonine protein kinase [Myxococcales bacterium]|nr:serine/threonine protein kinase [Myxococcales bacterium]
MRFGRPVSAPTHVGPYRVVRILARGGMGEVFLATLEREGGFRKRVAVKRVLPGLVAEPGYGERFVAEARVAASLAHRNIVQVFDFGQDDGAAWLAMEYVHGLDLKAVLDRLAHTGAPLPIGLALEIGLCCARALDHAHRGLDSARVIHRDVSPQNVLLGFDGDVKLADFGLALAVTEAARSDGTIQGKYAYMSPEQAAGAPLDPRTDLFSLGVVLYECLTGVRAFASDEGPLALLDRVLEARALRPITDFELPSPIVAEVVKLLDRLPSQRHETAAHLVDALREAARASNVSIGEPALGPFLSGLFPERVVHGQLPSPVAVAGPMEATEAAVSPIAASSIAEPMAQVAVPVPSRRRAPWAAIAAVSVAAVLAVVFSLPRVGGDESATEVPHELERRPNPVKPAPSAPPVIAEPPASLQATPPFQATAAPDVKPRPTSSAPRSQVRPPPTSTPEAAALILAVPTSAAPPTAAPAPPTTTTAGPRLRILADDARVHRGDGGSSVDFMDLTLGAAFVQIVGGPGPPVTLRARLEGGHLRANITARPYGQVVLDGRQVGETPLADLVLQPGLRDLLVRGPDGKETRLHLTIEL